MNLKNISLFVIGILFTGFSQVTWAEEQVIELSVNGCNVSLSMPTGNSCDQSQCASDDTCICASKGDHIKWTINNEDKFKLKFSADSPLQNNCGKNYKGKKHKCVVKESTSKGESFTYDIKLKRCANGTDPKIIIK